VAFTGSRFFLGCRAVGGWRVDLAVYRLSRVTIEAFGELRCVFGPDCRVDRFIRVFGRSHISKIALLIANDADLLSDKALSLLCTSTGAEIALGIIVICVVAVLGQLEPAGHMHSGAMSAMVITGHSTRSSDMSAFGPQAVLVMSESPLSARSRHEAHPSSCW
jgi:hypothetical protein